MKSRFSIMAVFGTASSVVLASASRVISPPASDIRPIKPLISIPQPWLWFLWSLAILIAAALAWYFWRRRAQKQEAKPVIVIPAHERAFQRLLKALELMHQPKPFTIEVSDTLRHYLEERFDFHAPERTTEEFLNELQTSAILSNVQKQSLGRFLQNCDMVKFARYEPGPPELRELYDAAVKLITETRAPDPLPAPPPLPATPEKTPA